MTKADAASDAVTADDDEEDYLTMTFDDPTTSTKNESLTQRKKRLAREAEERSRPKSKAQIAEEEKKKRDAALNKKDIDTQSKGYKMMAALGYKQGTALGKANPKPENGTDDTRLLEPIGLEMKEDRGGIGADAEKKRKFREEVAHQADGEKKRKVDAEEFRERQQKEREEKRMEGQLWGAMKAAEKLDDEDNFDTDGGTKQKKPLSNINVLWRSLAKQRALNDHEKRMKYDLHQSLSMLPTYDDPEEDAQDIQAIGNKKNIEEVDLELDQDDPELDQFEALEISEKLDKIVAYLREQWHYCFWCKFRYPDENMDGCPGLSEEEHD